LSTGRLAAVQQLFQAVTSAADFLHAAHAVEPVHPEIAELLRTYGAGRTIDAESHFARHN
jgi:hypothetical protein